MTTTTAPATPEVKVGDFFVDSWGYDQTNIDFYKVVGLTKSGKSVRVQAWTKRVVSDNGPSTHVVPGDSPKVGCYVRVEGGWEEYRSDVTAPVVTKRLRPIGSQVYIASRSYSSARLWDGRPAYETGAGFGH